jgi:hypothetical protein
MDRKFRKDRFYKIVKAIVNIVTAFCLILGILLFIKKEQTTLYFLDGHTKCIEENKGNEELIRIFCDNYLDLLTDFEKQLVRYWIIGIGLPVIFYGGGFLINYLYPKKDVDD